MRILVLAVIISVFFGACSTYKPKTTFDSKDDFYNYARYFFTKQESKLFKNLKSSEDRDRFIKDFWQARETAEDTGPSFKEIILERYEFASKYLREANIPGWKTERGRIYLLLGEPSEIYKNDISTTSIKGEILWYYSDNPSAASYSGTFLRFVDKHGHGIYQMDLFNSSLKLLDRIEEAKYQVLNRETTENRTSAMKFNISINKELDNLHISIDPESVSFEKNGSEVSAKLEVKILYYQDKLVNKFRETYKLNFKENDLIESNSKIDINVPVQLNPGKTQADIFITDLNSGKTFRKVVTLKKKKN